MHYLADAYIIHYFHNKHNPYSIANEKYINLPYNDKHVKKFIKNPYTSFEKTRLLEINDKNLPYINTYPMENTSTFIFLNNIYKNHKKIFNFIENILKNNKKYNS